LGVREADFIEQIHHFEAGNWATIKSIRLVYVLGVCHEPAGECPCQWLLAYQKNGHNDMTMLQSIL
jgi:hypothetical protein